MKKQYYLLTLVVLVIAIVAGNWAISNDEMKNKKERNALVDTRVDNNGYWKKMAKEGLATLNPDRTPEKAVYKGSKISANSVRTFNSPDVPVTEENSTQSENSIFVNPNDALNPLNSNNSTQNPVGSLYGANDLYSFDAGETWDGEVQGAGGSNSGDPTTSIGLNGRYYINYISNSYGMGISYSDDQGQTWTTKEAAPNPGQLADKNHMWIDNSPTSSHEGNLYIAWTNFGGGNDSEIGLSYSHDDGESWTVNSNISAAVNAGSHNQGVNLQTGPNGEVYAVWAIYDSWPSDETAIGFAISMDGGVTWEPATRIIENIRGIRTTETSKNMRVNSFPVMAVDISGGANNGTLYVTWANIGEPGVNTGNDIDVYISKSTDQGASWSSPVKVNQDDSGQGKEHYFPWVTCDPENGALSVIFYDDRNVTSTQCEVFCANSFDGGDTWEDFQVSDVSFTPSPIPGLAGGYFGDYLAISARGGWVYPCWTDNRSGVTMTYVSPYQTNPLPAPRDLLGVVTFETGAVDLEWSFEGGDGFLYFNVYRDGTLLGTTTDTVYTDMLPDYGVYLYGVTAYFEEDGESMMAKTYVQWGDAHISVTPEEISETLLPGESSTHYLTIHNIGQLELDFDISPLIQTDNGGSRAYCEAGATTTNDEYIQRVQVGTIDNTSGGDGYHDYTDLSTTMNTGESYEITVTNGTTQWPSDQCGIWVDWNQNEDFEDDEPISVSGSPGSGPYTANIQPPVAALAGETRLRIRITYSQTPEPCGIDSYGEVEDYTIFVSNWLSLDIYEGQIPAGNTMQIAVTLDASQLALGDYSAELHISSNDPDQELVIVPISLTVSEYGVNATATPSEICYEENVQLSADPVGGSGTYTYAWTSDPAGFTSSEQNPEFGPLMETTTFTVVLDDGNETVSDDVTVTVHPLPVISLGTDTTICEGTSIVLDPGAGFVEYLWQNDSTSQTITVSETGDYWVEVMDVNGCVGAAGINVTVSPLPTANFERDTTACAHLEVVLDAGGHTGYTYLWSNDATTQTIMVDSSGIGLTGSKTFWVEITNEFSCTSVDTVTINFKDCTGIEELAGSLGINAYPNPTDGQFTLFLETETQMDVNIRIVNQLGKVIFNKKQITVTDQHQEKINLTSYPNGIYTVIIDNDMKRWTKNIIVK